MKVEADRLKKVLGLTRVSFRGINHPIAVTDVPLDESTANSAVGEDGLAVDRL
jgi:hypothetical protein